MLVSRLLLTGLALCLPHYALSAEDFVSVEDARNKVSEYRALRKACAITQGQQRKVCFSQLNESTARYQKAKKFLALQQPTQGTMLGQAQ